MFWKFLIGLTYVWIFALWITTGLIHIWTIYIAYENSGWFWGLVTMFFPLISQIIWGVKAYAMFGLQSAYIQWLIIVVIAWIMNFLLQFVLAIVEARENNKLNRKHILNNINE